MNRYEFHLRTADQYLDYYRGTARSVVVRCTTGQNVQFPASLLQQFVTTEGKLQAMLPKIQERLTSKLNQLREIGGSPAPVLGDTPLLVVIEHADGRITIAWIELIGLA